VHRTFTYFAEVLRLLDTDATGKPIVNGDEADGEAMVRIDARYAVNCRWARCRSTPAAATGAAAIAPHGTFLRPKIRRDHPNAFRGHCFVITLHPRYEPPHRFPIERRQVSLDNPRSPHQPIGRALYARPARSGRCHAAGRGEDTRLRLPR
jgi:hypothetical protein